jgi:hypothetical protein
MTDVGRKFALFLLTLHDYAPILTTNCTTAGQNRLNYSANERLKCHHTDE